MKWLLALFASICFGLANAQPFTPPPNPPPPTFMTGFLPVVIVNDSGLPDDQIFILVTASEPVTGFGQFVKFTDGVGELVLAEPTMEDVGPTFSVKLSDLPMGSTGRVIYLPPINSALILFSIDKTLVITVNPPHAIVEPNFLAPDQPNYTTIFDMFELAFLPPTVSANPTAVSFFSIPLYAFLSTPTPGSNAGLFQPRNFIMATVESFLNDLSVPPATAQWNNLVLKSDSTILRIIAPEKGMSTTPPLFDRNYLDNEEAYGFSYINFIWTNPNSFYRQNALRLTIPTGSLDTYTGVIKPDNSITFTGTNPSHVVRFFPPTRMGLMTTSDLIFGGLPLYDFETVPGDGVQVSKLFEEAIMVGFVPTTATLTEPFLVSNQNLYYMINPNLPLVGQQTGPWYNLYSKALHSLGFIFTFAFDDALWPQVLLSSPFMDGSTYLGITIGNLTESASAVEITSSQNPSVVGETVTFTATVTGVPATATPTGTVTFIIDGVAGAPIPLVNGKASLQTSTLSVGSHTIVATYSGDAVFPPATSAPLIQNVIAVPAIFPPRNLHVTQVKNKFATQTDVVNIITWQRPLLGITPVLYRIYRNPELTKLIATVPADNKSRFKFKDHNRKPGRTYRYFIVSVDEFGNVSTPAEVVFHGKKRSHSVE
jgi:Beta-1,3-glucanase/Bacterial Ig-like domain (group 3)